MFYHFATALLWHLALPDLVFKVVLRSSSRDISNGTYFMDILCSYNRILIFNQMTDEGCKHTLQVVLTIEFYLCQRNPVTDVHLFN